MSTSPVPPQGAPISPAPARVESAGHCRCRHALPRKQGLHGPHGRNGCAWLIDANGANPVDNQAEVYALRLPIANGFAKLLWKGRPTVYLGIADDTRHDQQTVPDAFTLATHEAYHFFAQNQAAEWADTTSTSSRAADLPLQFVPRQYRAQLLLQLQQAIKSVNVRQNALGHASYWYQCWKREFPAEASRIALIDRIEGSAQYVGFIGQLLAEGHTFSSPHWQSDMQAQALVDIIKKQEKNQYKPLSIAQESYFPGQLSGVLLDLAGVVWLPRVAQGETPLAILLEPVAPIAERGDTALNAHIQQAVENKSRQAQEQLAPFLRLRLAKKTQYLLLPDTSMQGSFTLHDDYRIPPDPAEIQRISATFNPEEGRVVADNAWASTIHYDCGQGFRSWHCLPVPCLPTIAGD